MMSSVLKNQKVKKVAVELIHPYVMKFDGCCKVSNPGICGTGVVLYKDNVEVWNKSTFMGFSHTNNEAEYQALKEGLTYCLDNNIDNILIQGDSMLVIRQMQGLYKVKSEKLASYYADCKIIASKMNVFFQHITRDKNTRADELANLGVKHIMSNKFSK